METDRKPAREPVALSLHLASLLAALVVILVINRRMWFTGDDFDFLTRRGLHGATVSIWAPHGPHWSTLPILIWRAIYVFAAMRTATPYLVLLYLAHLALVHVLWRVMRSSGANTLVATLLCAVFAVLGWGADDILWAFQIGFVSSLLLGWIVILLLNRSRSNVATDVLTCLLGIVALTTSGVAVSMLIVAGLLAVVRRGWRVATAISVPWAVVYGVWFALEGHQTAANAVGKAPLHSVLAGIPAYVWSGVVYAFSAGSGSDTTAAGIALIVALSAWIVWVLWRRSPLRDTAAPALLGLVGLVVFYVVTAFGRDHFGADQTHASRYVYVALAMALPAVGVALSSLVRFRRELAVAVVVVLLACGVSNFIELINFRNGLLDLSLRSERQLVAAYRIGASQPTIPSTAATLRNLSAGYISLATVEQIGRQGGLPTGVMPQPLDVVDAATEIQLALTSHPVYRFRGGHAEIASGSRKYFAMSRTGCEVAASRRGPWGFEVSVSQPSSVQVVAHLVKPSTVRVHLVIAGVSSDVQPFQVGRSADFLDIAATYPAVVVLSLAEDVSATVCPGITRA
jgi:hypothetical protein